MKEQLKHIFEPGACLTARQLKNYVSGKMVHEEAHAAEAHLLCCPLCNDAVEGMLAEKNNGSLNGVDKLDAGFIAKHFGVSVQEVKSVVQSKPVLKAGAYTTEPEKKKAVTSINWKPAAMAAGLLLLVGVVWVMKDKIFPTGGNDELAQAVAIPQPPPREKEIAYSPAVDTSAVVADTIAVITDAVPAPETTPVPDAVQKQQELLAAKKAAEKKTEPAVAVAQKALSQPKAEQPRTPSVAAAEAGNTGADRRTGNSFTGPEAPPSFAMDNNKQATETLAEVKKPAKKIPPGTAHSGLEKADDLYNKGKYRRALKMYQDEMFDSKSNKKESAKFMAAKCHVGLGEYNEARTLLNGLVSEGSPKKAQAQQLLNELNSDE